MADSITKSECSKLHVPSPTTPSKKSLKVTTPLSRQRITKNIRTSIDNQNKDMVIDEFDAKLSAPKKRKKFLLNLLLLRMQQKNSQI